MEHQRLSPNIFQNKMETFLSKDVYKRYSVDETHNQKAAAKISENG